MDLPLIIAYICFKNLTPRRFFTGFCLHAPLHPSPFSSHKQENIHGSSTNNLVNLYEEKSLKDLKLTLHFNLTNKEFICKTTESIKGRTNNK